MTDPKPLTERQQRARFLCRLGLHDWRPTGKGGHNESGHADYGDRVEWRKRRWMLDRCVRCGTERQRTVKVTRYTSNEWHAQKRVRMYVYGSALVRYAHNGSLLHRDYYSPAHSDDELERAKQSCVEWAKDYHEQNPDAVIEAALVKYGDDEDAILWRSKEALDA